MTWLSSPENMYHTKETKSMEKLNYIYRHSSHPLEADGFSGDRKINYDPTFALGSDIDGNQNVLVVGWRGISGNSANSSVSLMWREL